MYQVICKFADLLDSNHVYEEGAEYPRKGYSPSSDRIDELSTNRNKAHRPLIVFVPEKEAAVVQAVVEAPEPVVQEVVQEPVKPARGRKKKDANNAN